MDTPLPSATDKAPTVPDRKPSWIACEPLPIEALYRTCDLDALAGATAVLPAPAVGLIGQERANEAISFGIDIRKKGFNIFCLGPAGTGKHTLVRTLLEAAAKAAQTPPDWCYINNFADPHRPKWLKLPAGRGRALHQSMEKLIAELQVALPAAFERDDYRHQRDILEQQFKKKHEENFGGLQERAEQMNVTLIRTPVGFALAPTRNGDVIPQEEFKKFTAEEQERIKADITSLQAELEALLRQVPQWERELRRTLEELDRKTTTVAVGYLIEEVRHAFLDLPDVLSYLGDVEHDITENAGDFLAASRESGANQMAMFRQVLESDGASFRRYHVNVIVDNSGTSGAPIVYDDRPNHQSLAGRIEHQARLGALVTDFNLLVSGSLHQANGGYLIIDAERLLTGNFGYETLKRALRTEEIRLESLEQILSIASTVSLEPQPIPLDVKVILIGTPRTYYLLRQHDPDFAQLFKIAAEFDDQVDRNEETIAGYARLLTEIGKQNELRPLARDAAARVIEYASRTSGDSEKLSTRIRSLTELLQEADCRAGLAARQEITRGDIQDSLDAQNRRADRIYHRILEEIGRKTIMIEVDGARIGQINGLATINLGNIIFGYPSRITARVASGRGDVVDIEREVELSGSIHSKGVLILSGFLKGRFGRNAPLSLDASLVFEQSYGGVDGDSASSAELYALLSALAELPIQQNLAVTGSVDQYGHLQAIGGVNEKIEGFFDVCSKSGLTGKQGVLIPAANVKQLMLRPDVVRACAEGQFKIYPVETVDQGIALLTGYPAGEQDISGKYPKDTVNYWVAARFGALAARQMRMDALLPRPVKGGRDGR
ncbi:MAG TPA: AAA family ATPase [Dongiaceae bacterium]|nr:AAA family ATPase [Dongiaceae bacterium]